MASLGGMYESSYMYSSQFMNTMNPPSFEKVQFFTLKIKIKINTFSYSERLRTSADTL